MDAIDKKIIELLKGHSRITSSDISRETHLSVPAVSERIRKLEDRGIVEKFTVKLNREAFGRDLTAFLLVQVERNEEIPVLLRIAQEHGDIMECHHLAGMYDYMLKVAVNGTKGLEILITDVLKKQIASVRVHTSIVLRTHKEEV